MKMLDRWEWGDTIGSIALLVATCFVSLIVYAICQDHSPRFFYINASTVGFCVTTFTEWTPNKEAVFCSDDIHKSLDVMDHLNAALNARKR